jgi:hypothetical protein
MLVITNNPKCYHIIDLQLTAKGTVVTVIIVFLSHSSLVFFFTNRELKSSDSDPARRARTSESYEVSGANV